MTRVSLALCIVPGLAALAVCTPAIAQDDAPAFDRPGISFAPSTLARGAFAWEQGLPDVERDDRDGITTTISTADTLLRFGIADGLELQLGSDAYNHLDTRGGGRREARSGGGDARVGLKAALPGGADRFSWAALASASLPVGQAPFGGDGHAVDVGVTLGWDFDRDRSLSAYLDRDWRSDDDDGWMFASGYAFPVGNAVGAYVEAGIGTGSQHARVAGGGLTWTPSTRVQLDASFLRGLDARSPDWQGGIGVSFFFAGTSAAR